MPVALPPTVRASIDFLDPSLSEKPYSCLGAPPPDTPPTNIKPYPVEVEISDLRGVAGYLDRFTVETSGFQVGSCPLTRRGPVISLSGGSRRAD